MIVFILCFFLFHWRGVNGPLPYNYNDVYISFYIVFVFNKRERKELNKI